MDDEVVVGDEVIPENSSQNDLPSPAKGSQLIDASQENSGNGHPPPPVFTAMECPPPPPVLSCDHSHFEGEIARLRKEVELANKAKETTVMRYANSEKEVLRRDKELENVNKQLKNYMRETETLTKRNKTLGSERERLALMIDSKVCEIQNLQKDLDKAKEDVSAKDFKIKWTQSKLTGETEAHKITLAKLQKCEHDLSEAVAEADRMRQDCRDMIASCSPEPSLSNTVSFASQSYYEYIPSSSEEVPTDENLLQPTSGSRSPASESFLREIETLKQKHKALIDENNSLSCRVQQLEESRLDNEQKIMRFKESNAEHLHQIASLHSDLAVADSWKRQLEKEQERILSTLSECDQLRQCNSELLADMAICRDKEAELLAYTQQVTGKNVQLQSEFSSVEAKSTILTEENQRLQKIIDKLQDGVKSFDKIISQEKQTWHDEREEFLSSLEQKDKIIQDIQDDLDEAKGEIMVMKKKHETTLKELRKELETLRRQCKEMNGEGLSSRTSSSTSLNQAESSSKSPDSNHANSEHVGFPIVPDQQVLVERIVKLQRSLAKKQEKIEFLSEHGRQLLENLQQKSKIIQAYAMNQEIGALSIDIPPHHKSELAKQGGFLSSLHGSKSMDDSMTFELSLEINRKFQAVLEDALMKNITLKESMRTLGSEICRLTEVNKELCEKIKDKKKS